MGMTNGCMLANKPRALSFRSLDKFVASKRFMMMQAKLLFVSLAFIICYGSGAALIAVVFPCKKESIVWLQVGVFSWTKRTISLSDHDCFCQWHPGSYEIIQILFICWVCWLYFQRLHDSFYVWSIGWKYIELLYYFSNITRVIYYYVYNIICINHCIILWVTYVYNKQYELICGWFSGASCRILYFSCLTEWSKYRIVYYFWQYYAYLIKICLSQTVCEFIGWLVFRGLNCIFFVLLNDRKCRIFL